MEKKDGLAPGIGLSILSLFIGIGGIAALIGVGERANSSLIAFLAVSLRFAAGTIVPHPYACIS